MKREMHVADAAQVGRDAFERQAWAEAFAHLLATDEAAPLEIDDLELLATSAYLIGKDELSAELFARAHQECLRSSDVRRAARFAFWLVLLYFVRGEIAQASGWLARGQRLLDDEGHDCPEGGLLLVMNARLDLKRGDTHAAAESAGDAVEMSRRFDDAELRVFAQLILGQVRVWMGEAAEAATVFDEAMVAVTIGDVSPFAVGVVYCAVIDACRRIFDVQRAREWTAALSRWCTSQPDLVPFRGLCLVHRVEIMRLSGAWSEAIAEAERACAWLSQLAGQSDVSGVAAVMQSFKYPIGAAYYELGEAYRVRGEFAKAEESYRQASRYGQSPEPGLALLRTAQGNPEVAETAIRRAFGQSQNRLVRAEVLAAYVEIMIALRDLPSARAAAAELAAIATDLRAPYLKAAANHAMGSVLLAEGDALAALAALRVAWMAWQEIEAPYNAARVRVLLGLACLELGDNEAAELELDSARRVFERLGAASDVARVNGLVNAMTRSHVGSLTPRELQVIGLVATGKSNRAIAQQLAISERTVDRHVSSILMKLELESRSAATAYAYQHRLV